MSRWICSPRSGPSAYAQYGASQTSLPRLTASLTVPGVDLDGVFYLRSLADSQAIGAFRQPRRVGRYACLTAPASLA